MTALTRSRNDTSGAKSIAQTLLEKISGRDLDPVEISFSTRTVSLGQGYHRYDTVKRVRNLRTQEVTIEIEKGNIA